MSKIETIAQADRVHDVVHQALDNEITNKIERFRKIRDAILETDKLLMLLDKEIM